MSQQLARAFWVDRPGEGDIRSETLRPPGAGEVRVRTLYSGISRGTECLVFRGGVPPSEYRSMRAPFQCGDFPGPVKYGYSSVGVVEAGPEALGGRTVFCLHPHQDRFVVPADRVHPVPAGIPPGRAVLAANMESAVNALWDAPPRLGDRIAVVGGGTLGCLVAYLASRVPGARVELVDTNPARAAVAERLGVAFARPARAAADADLVVHTSAQAAGLDTALSLAGLEATVLELSWYGTTPVSVSLGADFHSRRLKLESSQVGQVAAARRARRSRAARLELALSLLDDPALDALVSGEDPFQELPRVMARLAGGELDALCHRIVYP
jgi:threonine dehydrogenase-like Zn-dependent dehydrogenase